MATINTNPGAMIALQNLNQTNRDLMQVQNRINTGLAVSSAKGQWRHFSPSPRACAAKWPAFAPSTSRLDLAVSVTDVGLAAGESHLRPAGSR